MYKFVALALLFSVVSAGQVTFHDCGHKEVTKLEISQCSGDLCTIHKGKDLKLDATFVANQNSKKVEIKISANVNGLEMQVPGVESNGCHHMKCPVVKGQTYEFDYSMFVPKLLPNVKADVTAQLIGDNGILACVTVKGQVSD